MPERHYSSRTMFLYFMGGVSESEAAQLERHLAGCDRCVARARVELNAATSPDWWSPRPPGSAPAAPIVPPSRPAPPAAPSTSRAAVIARVVGAMVLAVASVSIILPKLHWPSGSDRASDSPSGMLAPPAHVDWPLEASLGFRLKAGSETSVLEFPHHPAVHLSPDYEYFVRFAAHRRGWPLLFSVDETRAAALLLPGGATERITQLEAGQETRFPAESLWAPASAVPGRHELYAVYMNDAAAAQKLVDEIRSPDAARDSYRALTRKLDHLVVADGCTSADQPCVLIFEYEVF